MISSKSLAAFAALLFITTAFTSYTFNVSSAAPAPIANVQALSGDMEAVWHPSTPDYDCQSSQGVSYCKRW